MPLYDYKCKECQYTEERFFKMKEAPYELVLCPNCEESQLTKCLGGSFVPLLDGGGSIMKKRASGKISEDQIARREQQLVKRSQEYDKSPAGRERRRETMERFWKRNSVPVK